MFRKISEKSLVLSTDLFPDIIISESKTRRCKGGNNMFVFEYYSPTKVIFGKGTENQAGELVKAYGAKKVLITMAAKVL